MNLWNKATIVLIGSGFSQYKSFVISEESAAQSRLKRVLLIMWQALGECCKSVLSYFYLAQVVTFLLTELTRNQVQF